MTENAWELHKPSHMSKTQSGQADNFRQISDKVTFDWVVSGYVNPTGHFKKINIIIYSKKYKKIFFLNQYTAFKA